MSDLEAVPPTRVRAARPEDLDAVLRLLEQADLPTVGVAEWLPRFVVAECEGELIGAAGLEQYGEHALLRSVVVRPGVRGTGTGASLVRHALDAAGAGGACDITLLTTTAEDWFPRFGFRRIERAEAPEALGASAEFRGACPASAAVLWRVLGLGEG
jgi:amino-acid N-acetyltransferase